MYIVLAKIFVVVDSPPSNVAEAGTCAIRSRGYFVSYEPAGQGGVIMGDLCYLNYTYKPEASRPSTIIPGMSPGA